MTDLVPEDRCHLNGLAVRDGQPRYVTALGTTDTAGGWRERKADGGVLIDVRTSEILVRGLSMPHSPRWYDNRLWVLNSGTGELLVVDPESGRCDVACSLPGYLRGLTFVGPYALVGLCKIREKHIFGGLPVQQTHRTTALRHRDRRFAQRNGSRLFRIHGRLRRAVRNPIFAGRSPPDDSEPRQAASAAGRMQSRLVVLAASEQRDSR